MDAPALATILTAEQLATVDLFDRLQLEQVIAICRRCRSLSEAGRTLFNRSRAQRSSTNDADRLRKYLARFELNWDAVKFSAPIPSGNEI